MAFIESMFEHIQKLSSSQYSLELSLIRHKDYYGKVFYYITLSKIFPEIGNQDIIQETYPGTERHKAIKRFEALKKEDIYVRHFSKERISNYLRISIGTKEEMQTMIGFLQNFLAEG